MRRGAYHISVIIHAGSVLGICLLLNGRFQDQVFSSVLWFFFGNLLFWRRLPVLLLLQLVITLCFPKCNFIQSICGWKFMVCFETSNNLNFVLAAILVGRPKTDLHRLCAGLEFFVTPEILEIVGNWGHASCRPSVCSWAARPCCFYKSNVF